ncbi:MAG TPA: hypothetical protein VKP30_21930, partial [Polyangiaceae bacterium]|nr:hypothetical protein [Polyangiaceae bacterium]
RNDGSFGPAVARRIALLASFLWAVAPAPIRFANCWYPSSQEIRGTSPVLAEADRHGYFHLSRSEQLG